MEPIEPRMDRSLALPILDGAAALPVAALPWGLNPFLHVGEDRVYHPLTDRTLDAADGDYATLRAAVEGLLPPAEMAAEAQRRLAEAGWLVPAASAPERLFRLKYVSLEAHTVCNQACYF